MLRERFFQLPGRRAMVLLRCFTGRLLGPSRFGFLCVMPQSSSSRSFLFVEYVRAAADVASLAPRLVAVNDKLLRDF